IPAAIAPTILAPT
ncbi:hypothetical protein A2U01_0118749, partial [Trifolium medium]|nr:hypothetical protein [Trifolium medium]